MRIAIIGDTHFGYTRFEEDSHKQGESALLDASEKADIILLAGDVFHTKIPKFETIQRVINTLKKIKIPIIAIHGNHERRSTDMINTLQLLNSGELINYIHNGNYSNEKVNIVGLGSIPSNYVKEGLEKCLEKNKIQEGKFNILIIHQDIEELSVQGEISFDD